MTHREETEKMMAAELLIIKDMKELIKKDPKEGLEWKSTKQDLFQMIHILYESEEMTDEYGVPLSYQELVRRFCNILRIQVPRNPCTYVRQSLDCKGCRRAPLLMRYVRMFV
ncbi:MAG: hypothetical protein KBT34_08085 [Prevotella sp.]|nr:hypothetical protein [Candidatus Prevotella equi]